MVATTIVVAGVVCSAYEVIEAYKSGGTDSAANKLVEIGAITVVGGGVARAGFKAGAIIYPTLERAFQACVASTPAIKSIITKAGAAKNTLGGIIQKAPKAFPKVGKEKLLWSSWKNYPKKITGGKTYAVIGERLYTRHAINRMQPSSLGAPAGGKVAGRNITPNMVEKVIAIGSKNKVVVDGVNRMVHSSGNIKVVSEQNEKLIITVLRGK